MHLGALRKAARLAWGAVCLRNDPLGHGPARRGRQRFPNPIETSHTPRCAGMAPIDGST